MFFMNMNMKMDTIGNVFTIMFLMRKKSKTACKEYQQSAEKNSKTCILIRAFPGRI